ncbi:hypothetical protein [Natrinema sp. DC36]|uniref:hypothetical protein n=1 Tax=Natrinema sp. DC36 TaxID=2878680 RepID=UPI001CF035AD|nr:hypothetical protein [Natrinema sp. DC36]
MTNRTGRYGKYTPLVLIGALLIQAAVGFGTLYYIYKYSEQIEAAVRSVIPDVSPIAWIGFFTVLGIGLVALGMVLHKRTDTGMGSDGGQ